MMDEKQSRLLTAMIANEWNCLSANRLLSDLWIEYGMSAGNFPRRYWGMTAATES